VPSILELEVTEPEPRKFATAQRSKKAPVTVRSEVHTATKPPITKKKATKSSAVPEAQGKVATPKKELVIETPRLDMMVQVAKQAVQNLKDREELQMPDPAVYCPTYGPVSKSPKPSQVKGKSKVSGKGKAAITVTASAEGRSVTASTVVPAPAAETPVTATTGEDIETQQNQANEAREERHVSSLRMDLELSSDTDEKDDKDKTIRHQMSDVESDDSETESQAQKPEQVPTTKETPVPEIVAAFHESIVISDTEASSETPSTSTSAAVPVPSVMSLLPPVPLTDIHIPLRKPTRPERPHTPMMKLKAELPVPEAVPRAPEVKQHVKRRTKKVTSMHLTNATLNFRRMSAEIASDFAVTYQLTADERYQVQREVAKMRLSQKVLSLKMRAQF